METPTPTGSGYDRFRKRKDRRGFRVAFLVSGFFHLSMVTVFSIVIYFPRFDTRYYDFEIVPLTTPTSQGLPEGEGVESLAGMTDSTDKLALRGLGRRNGDLPAIQLPTLEFAELERLRVGQSGAQALSRYDELFKAEATDSWARFSRGLSDMSRSLATLQLSEGSPTPGGAGILDPMISMPAPIVHRPAEGFEALLIWATAPRDRKLLYAPPIEALWSAEESDLRQPIELVLQVNPTGRVVNVFSPSLDDRALVDAVQMTALRYRFEPLGLDDGSNNQTVTLQIKRDNSEAMR